MLRLKITLLHYYGNRALVKQNHDGHAGEIISFYDIEG